jgi:hypothetical protein
MGYLITAVVALLGALAALTIVGLFLPQQHTGRATRGIAAPPDKLWALMEREKDWFPNTPPTIILEGTQRPTKRISKINDPSLPYGGIWTVTLDAQANQTQVSILEEGEVYNPLFRFLARFVFGHNTTANNYLQALAREAAK